MGAYINSPKNFKYLKTERYIDKTGMISYLNARINTDSKYVRCVELKNFTHYVDEYRQVSSFNK
jgi:hypothetical protein